MLEIKRQTTVPTSWVEIKEVAKNGELRELLQLGDELSITLKTGEEVTLQLADMTLGDRPCFVLKDCLRDEKQMNKRSTNEGGWEKCFLREYLNETIFHMLPDELQEIIVPRVIRQKLDGETIETEDKLWLPSFAEMFGENDSWAPADAGDIQFQLFTTERSRVKECGDRGTWWYWLRSPDGSNSTSFCLVTSTGSANNNNACSANGVAFGFCL